MATLTLMVGIPGAGKSTYTKTKIDRRVRILSSDAIRKELFRDEADQEHNDIVFDTLYSRARQLLIDGKDVLIDATNSTKQNRARSLEHFKDLSIRKKAIVIETPVSTCIERDKGRRRTVGCDVIKEFADEFEYPAKDEGFDEIVHILSTENGFMRTLNTTLLLIIKDDKILLARKKRGFGAGLYNGVGGKVEQNETIEQGMLREVKEEINITPTDFKKRAEIKFDEYVNGERAFVYMTIYTATNYEGELQESNEVAPEWFELSKIPYTKMFPDDSYWLPEILKGNNVEGFFHYDINLNILSKDIKTKTED